MIKFARICVAFIYLGAAGCYFYSEKKYALFFGVIAGIALVLAGQSDKFETGFLSAALALLNLTLLLLILFRNKRITILKLSLFQLPLVILWFFYYAKH